MLATLFRASASCIKLVGADGTILEMNEAGLRMLEAVDPSEVIGTNVFERIMPEDRAAFISAHNRVHEGKGREVVSLTFWIEGLRGGRRQMESRLAYFESPGEGLSGVLSVSHDCTDHVMLRLRATQEKLEALNRLRKTEARLAEVLKAAKVRMILADSSERILLAAGEGKNIRGVPPDQASGHTLEERYAEVPEILAGFRSCFRTGRRIQSKCRVGDSDYDLQLIPVRDDHGAVAEVLGLAIESTDRQQISEELRRTETLLRILVDTSPVAIYVTDVSGAVRTWNPAAEKLFGWKREEVLGAPLPVIPLEARERYVRRRTLVLNSGAPLQDQVRAIRKDGAMLELYLSAARLTDGRGVPIGIAAIAFDVTDKARLEAELAHAEKLAALGTLAAGIGHEINNPLAYVTANLSVALERLPEEMSGVRALVADSLEGVERIAHIVQGLKLLTRKDGHATAPAELGEIAGSTLKVAEPQFRHVAQVRCDIEQGVWVKGQAGKLGQVALNLIVNAAQSMAAKRKSENRLTLRVYRRGDSGVLEVSDTGPGIRPEDLKRIFDPFFTTKAEDKGTGLGLSICNGIVATLGGRIDVDSTLGKGTTFIVALPLSDAPDAQARDSHGAGATTEDQTPDAGRLSILVIEDEPQIRSILGEILEKLGRVDAASDGLEALGMLREKGSDYDVILCDLNMPRMSGMALYRELETADPGLLSRFVFLTGGAVTPEATAFLKSCSCPTLDKPFKPRELRELVARKATDRAKLRLPDAAPMPPEP